MKMMYEEFMKIAGYKVSFEDYSKVIEPMYNATDMDKFDFVKCINRKRFEMVEKTERQYINELKKLAQRTLDCCGRCKDYSAEEKAYKLKSEMERFGGFWMIRKGYEIEETQRGCTYIAGIKHYTDDGVLIKDYDLV